MTDAIVAREIYKFFHAGEEETIALRGVNLTIAAGEFVVVVGPSGSGKSTLLLCLNGLDDPDSGVVEIYGQRMSRRPQAERSRIRARSIGIMMQSGNLFSHLNVLTNLRLQLRLADVVPTHTPEALLASLGLGERLAAMPSTLSGGERARAALAVALSSEPPILLCDEPTAEVDAATEDLVIATLKERQRRGSAILIATHSQVLAAQADRVLILRDGALA